ncbi:MAG: cytochrome o ubiquinol oxidase subunit III [Legionellaceae bacterium]|nr:cytochrome o ubiquinol oxidase subunit III [Legionellaceae bacterium]
MNQTLTKEAHAHHFDGSKNVFGFWMYIMTDCLLFATLFAVYAVFHTHTFGGPHAKELFSLPFVLVETMMLLTSSFTFGLAMLARNSRNNTAIVTRWMWVTFILGLCFIAMEMHEFHHLYIEGHTWATSAFLSSFFTLVGTHGLHVTAGLIWMLSVIFQINKHGITPETKTKLTCLGLFWHFLDIVWIFVFSVVYLMGAI